MTVQPDSAGAFHLGEEWFAAWRAAYRTPGQEAVAPGGIPMLAEDARLGPLRYRRLRSQTNVHTPRFDSAVPVADPNVLVAALMETRSDLVQIDFLAEDALLLSAARRWSGRFHVDIAPHAISPSIDCSQPFATWAARSTKRHRNRWRKLQTTLDQDHHAQFEVVTAPRDLQALLDECFALEQSGWKGREGTAILDSAADTQFYTDLAHRAAAAGALQIALLRDGGGRIIAFEYCLRADRSLFALKVAYDEHYEHLSVGHLLARRHICHACTDADIAWYDKLGNGMTPAAYKLRFADALRPLYRVMLFAPTWKGDALRLHHHARRRAKAARDGWLAQRAA